ncbi:ABC transporter [Amycolatopsis antarctica]|uniref:ABC transporter n=1 Tax=Amycolatopsis antarctica TaxID=1854586 RepID=A0A263CXT8_9PSEU|nr:ABC transporter permease [Amycolatopsis antarctica]OZM70146.1 ABC transporter [Amycolatopsis antarctica]
MTALAARIFRVELSEDLKGIVREPAALFFSVVLPVAFFAVFASIFGAQQSGPLPGGTIMLATFGAYGVLAVTLMNPGIGVATDRQIGWLRAKRVSAVPPWLTLSAKVAAALPYAAGVFGAMVLASALTGTLDASPGQLVRVGAVLLVGSLPFALLGLAVGFQAGTNAAVAILNGVLMPCAVVSGLWMPLEILPAFFGDVAVFLPTYHLSQLAQAQLDGGETLVHVLFLLGTAVVAGALAAASYRRARI